MAEEKKLTVEEQLATVTAELEKARIAIREREAVIDSIVPPEAVYSFSTTALGKDGMTATWTIRARVGENGQEFFHRADNFLQYAIKHGWTLPQRAPAPPTPVAANAPVAELPPAPGTTEDGGTAHAVLMKVGKSYSGGKPQLQFECEGLEHPLSYTRPVPDMVKLLAGVGKYTPDMMTDGKKWAVNYLIDWKLGDPNGEGKRYRNVIAVRLPQAA